jgi:predicted acetyltransferase
MIEIRVPTEEDWPGVSRADGRIFGVVYTEHDDARIRSITDRSRFRIAVDGSTIVGCSGSYGFEMTMPGGQAIPTGGVTWVSVAVTHRRQGLLGRLLDATHEDIDERGEPLAALTASEGGIYERFGYGVASRVRVTALDRHRAQLRAEFVPASRDVRLVEPEEALPEIMEVWERFRRLRAGELTRSEAWWRAMFTDVGPSAVHVLHPDGYACWKSEASWRDGHPAAELQLFMLAAVTPDAHAALWHTVVSADLVGPIVSRRVPIDDPLPFLLRDQRALRTTDLNDGLWCNVRDVAACFGARAYGSDDDVVVEVDGGRWRLGAGGAAKVRTKPDLVTDHAALGALLLGGVAPSDLAAGRRLEARSAEALRRADALFVVRPAPHTQTGF